MGKIPDLAYDTATIRLQRGDALFLYTDGVTEAMSAEKSFFEEARVVESLQQRHALPLKDMLDQIHDDLKKFTNGAQQSDDITMLTLRYIGGPNA